MTRIVAGSRGGRRIEAPPGTATRPTSDRVREALFSTLETMTALNGCHFADLYAGSGAIGLEAASRGAAAVLLVESDARAARIIRRNIDALDLAAVCRLSTAPVAAVVAAGAAQPCDVVYLDPPYRASAAELEAVLADLVSRGWLGAGAVVVTERSSRSPEPEWPAGITGQRGRRYGESVLWYGRGA